jgi:hypothetical protein
MSDCLDQHETSNAIAEQKLCTSKQHPMLALTENRWGMKIVQL